MGCFLSCFRGGADASSGDLRDPLVRESRIGDAFLNVDEKKPDEATGKPDAEAADDCGVDDELRKEANYLKSCGAISQTPPEIANSIPIISEDANECSNTPSNLQLMKKDAVLLEENSSELLNSHEHGVQLIKKDAVLLEENSSELLNSDEHVVQLMKKDTVLLEENSSELLNSDEHAVSRHEQANCLKSCGAISQTPPEMTNSIPIISEDANECSNTPSNLQLMKKDAVLLENSSELLNSDERAVSKPEQGRQSTDSSDSPYPTPLVLRGDIETPGTIYTAYKETLKPGKRTRASRQFIYPVLRPIENKMQWMELKAESPVLASNPPKRRNLSSDSSEKAQQMFAGSTVTETESPEHVSFSIDDNCAAQKEVISSDEGEESSKQTSEFGKHGVTSLSHWLKRSSADDETHSNPDNGSVGEVPIFPALGFNWETENPTPVLSKAWDGNGIPNTTTKYKEDQKVSWHATPFEERLMKVLSNEKPHHERKISGKLIHLEENAE